MASAGQTVIGLFLIADRDALIWVGLIMMLVSIAVVALLARQRKWPEIVCLFVIVFAASMFLSHMIFKHGFDLPFFKAEPISMTTD